MSMFIDLRQGESVIAFRRGDAACRMTITMERKLGSGVARLRVDAADTIEIVTPNKQRKITPP